MLDTLNSMLPFPVTLLPLIAANIFLIISLLQGKINIGEIMIIYWIETVIIGFINVAKMYIAKDKKHTHSKLYTIGFFIVHYGIFNTVHGVFIFVLTFTYLQPDSFTSLIIGTLTLLLSHLISFFYNYVNKEEYKTAKIDTLFTHPYSRIVTTHISILLGFFLMMWTKSTIYMPLLLILLKTIIDANMHIRERKKFAAAEI